MSLGTDLSAAYQTILDPRMPAQQLQVQQQQKQLQQVQQQNTPVRQILQQQQLQQLPAKPRQPQPEPLEVAQVKQKKDVLKTILLSTIILLAIATHSLVDYVIKDLSASFMMTFKQEIGARMLYPLIVFLLMYMIKIVWV